ncbi:protein of unknown function [Methylorubrum extorquens]|uniref:Uncharacterized protein n=1 Tax=Methylorubrum extorquens TaxID=408 RepID=A0A2N9AXR6_METEX|nr:protein of unknown function [Methylorubrum extorquens]
MPQVRRGRVPSGVITLLGQELGYIVHDIVQGLRNAEAAELFPTASISAGAELGAMRIEVGSCTKSRLSAAPRRMSAAGGFR